MTLLDRIFANCVRVNECLEWQRCRNKAGYGKLHVPDLSRKIRMKYVHRIVAEAMGAKIKGKVVRHSCDNPPCCNPKHLLVGTHADNTHDAMDRGRLVPPPRTNWPKRILNGDGHPWQKLSVKQVKQIRKRLDKGEKLASIANDFDVSFQQVSKIKLRQRWAYV